MEELARVYGRALFEVAHAQEKLELVREQLAAFADALEKDRRLSLFFFSPYFSTQEKQDALHRVVTGADEVLVNFLELLIEKHRMPVLFRVRDQYEHLWEEENRMLRSRSPARSTSTRDDREPRPQIGERAGRRVKLSAHVDPDILGGIIVRVGNSILDASIRTRLEQLRRHVAQGAL